MRPRARRPRRRILDRNEIGRIAPRDGHTQLLTRHHTAEHRRYVVAQLALRNPLHMRTVAELLHEAGAADMSARICRRQLCEHMFVLYLRR